ncbi:hypothetical protein DSM3645_27321 [Blastopirellula marina DSM 3645]|uniref:Uncharacterized protein n=1 Tax=Blastopirellula marina DSM 3645 TaxID=314230 RepID=A4A014_9BACT|nr:hypothetical protein DSM3645_27321 [Blastopirellula marina DSM 3645]
MRKLDDQSGRNLFLIGPTAKILAKSLVAKHRAHAAGELVHR